MTPGLAFLAALTFSTTTTVRAENTDTGSEPNPHTVDNVSADKSGYTLFNRTPDKLRREFTTDRPDVTYALGGNAQLDAGVLVGLNRHAPDLRLFSGFSIRF